MLKVSKFNNLELQNVPTIVGKWRLLTYEVSRSISYHLEVNFASNPPSPLEFPGPLTPPPPWNFQFPPWWGYGYFLELHNLSYDKRQEIIFQFFEEHILGIHTKKRSLCYRAVCCLCWDLNSDLNCLVERVFVF